MTKSETELALYTKKYQIVLAKKIRGYRGFKRLSQEKLCEMSGVSRPTLVKIENLNGCIIKPSLDTLFRIAAALEVEPSILLDESSR